MKIGICAWSVPMDGPYGVKVAADYGFEGMQLDIGEPERGFQLSYPHVQEAYKQFAMKYDITFTAISVRLFDRYGMTRENGTQEKDMVMEGIKKAIQAAESMNIPIVMLGSFLDSEIKTDEDFQRTVECLIKACEMAEGKNITIATENLLSIEENKKLFEVVNKENLKLYFDTQNYYLNRNYNAAEIVRELYDYICEVHVKDGNGHISGALLGEGDSNFFETMEVLKEKGYQGWVLIENYYDQKPLSNDNENPLELLEKDVKILKNAII
ncbi:sugar phosphate isomerase/epimerase [Oceanobacillus caeni]|uniref:sugar phosphate isomerase/epimerase family protein n=1 Tax=Oceanobacillus caeni TaxID=405946 RepID=UPI002149B4B9|nr:sugar phosphate isomerase/epimerase family protein [Oceanobacillus caeni]MCR1832860.1 sugar phosphate isomerase/epimerase [Oceanobacillus caeni]